MEISWQYIFWLIYPSVIVGAVFGMMGWRIKWRPTQFPLGEDIRLQRQPGEHLRLQVGEAWENLFFRLLGLMMVPLAAFLGTYYAVKLLPADFQLLKLALIVFVPLACLGIGLRRVCRLTDTIMNLRLGWFGERAVADQLECLKQKGYEIFHDVPCIGGSGPFNLDHVVVGNGVVVVVETKTYRKPKGTQDGHKVTYTGEMLCWPKGTSIQELEQALRNAEWLRKDLKKHLNVDTKVHPALTFPGWYVTGGPPKAPVLVESYKRLAGFITQRFPPQMTEVETGAVVRHLRRQCANLDYAALG